MRDSMSGLEGRQTRVFTPIIQVECNDFPFKEILNKGFEVGKNQTNI